MTEKATFRLPDQKLGHSLVVKGWEWAKEQIGLGKVVHVEFKLETRTDRQNRLLHALFSDIARQAEFAGKKRSAEQWKQILVLGHGIATKEECEIVQIEGEAVALRESTAKMTKRRMASLLEYVLAYAATEGIELRDSRQWMD